MARRSSPASPVTVLVASDWAPIRAFEPIIRDAPESIYGDLLPVLRRADLRIVNCECALTSADAAVWKSGAVFKGEPAQVAGLAAVPFDVACLANNHVLDYGVAGLRETMRVLARAGVQTVGAGLNDAQALAPLSLRVNGQIIHVINISEGEDLTATDGGPGVFGWDVGLAAAQARALKKLGGIVIVVAHGGLEYVPFPPPYVVAGFRALVEAGADCVIGHHPHVPQGIEWWQGRPIVYSLGNFVFFQQTTLHHRKVGFCVSLRCESGAVSAVELHPYRITGEGLRRLTPAEAQAFGRDLTRISRPFRTAAGPLRAWNAWLEYYGEAGFRAEVTGILEKMTADPRKAAAMFRNRITTMQHVEHWETFLTRMVDGGRRDHSRADYELVEEYFTRQADS
jgi:poly-gamma-glutamate capsule biosynthesis protein CapA/YwtB (metallophosphatase superfamily)